MATKIRCKYLDCAFLENNYCTAALVELDSDKGCLTYMPNSNAAETSSNTEDENWDEHPEETENWDELEEEQDDSEDDENEDDDDEDPWMDNEDEHF